MRKRLKTHTKFEYINTVNPYFPINISITLEKNKEKRLTIA